MAKSVPPGLVGAALFVATLLLRGFQLGQPATFVFDEIFYVNDAVDLVVRGVEQTRVGHPPLGKWLIGAGFAFTHFSPFMWRVSSLVAGAVVVVLSFVCARHLTGSTMMGVSAGILVLTDGIANAMGRYAFLDGFVSMFTTALLTVLILTVKRPVGYVLALGLGALSGAALATKWSAAPVVAIAFVVLFDRARRATTLSRAAAIVCIAAGASAFVYVGTNAPWIITGRSWGNCTAPACHSSAARRLALLPQIDRRMLESDARIVRTNNQLRPGWQWAYQRDAMQLFREPCRGIDDGVCNKHSRDVVLVAIRGNRVLWLAVWPAIAAWLVVRRRRPQLVAGVGLAATCAVALWVPWIALSKTFAYYAAPMVPALAIALIGSLHAAVPRRWAPLIVLTLVAGATVTLVATQPAAPWRA